MSRWVVVGNPGGQRVALLQAALARLGVDAVEVIAWADLLAGRATVAAHVREGDVVRIESPGSDFEVERALLLAGVDADDDAAFARASRSEVLALREDRGRILWPRQWYLGFCAALRTVASQLSGCAPHRLVSDPDAIAVMFDKVGCHATLRAAGVSVAPTLGAPRSFEELVAGGSRGARAFIKLAHGSSASGVVAWRTDGRRHQAVTTVEAVREGGALRLYNSLRLRTLDDVAEIAALVDALIAHRVHVEAWLPKAGVDGRTFDLRVVTIAGRARHVVVRSSRSPITNLHLGNERGDVAAVRRRAGAAAWDAAMSACEAAARAFPRQLHAGVDVMFEADFRRHAVLEVNAFGDLLPGALHEGEDTYEAEARAAEVEAT